MNNKSKKGEWNIKFSHRLFAILLALVMTLSLCACGGSSDQPDTTDGSQSGGYNNNQSGDNTENITPKNDTWENAMGQSGVMEYEYKGETLKKAIFKYGNTDKVWRTIEYGSFEDNAVGMRYYQTHYNSNDEVIFSLDIRYFEEAGSENVPQYITGHDYFYDETSCNLTLQSDGMIVESTIANTCGGAQDYWITQYAGNGLPGKTTVYSREGSKLCTWLFYYEEGRIAYGRACDDYYADATPKNGYFTGTTYQFEYDGSGKLVKLVEGYGIPNANGEIPKFEPKEQRDPENPIGITFQYDGDGRLSKRIKTESSLVTTQTFTYGSDGTITECEFTYGRIGSDNHKHAYFKMNSDSVLSSADFGFLSNANSSYYEFEYFENDKLSNIKAYDRSAINEDREYLDIEFEKEFHESETKYKSSYMKYYTDFYDENGEEIGSESGTYTEDGTKTPNDY